MIAAAGFLAATLLSLLIIPAVNRRAERFYDEGEDLWPKRYATWGALVARQPDYMTFVRMDLAGNELARTDLKSRRPRR